jgi:hypothetical protein
MEKFHLDSVVYKWSHADFSGGIVACYSASKHPVQHWNSAFGEATAPTFCGMIKNDLGQADAGLFDMPLPVLRLMQSTEAGFTVALAGDNAVPHPRFKNVCGIGIGSSSMVRGRASAFGLARAIMGTSDYSSWSMETTPCLLDVLNIASFEDLSAPTLKVSLAKPTPGLVEGTKKRPRPLVLGPPAASAKATRPLGIFITTRTIHDKLVILVIS